MVTFQYVSSPVVDSWPLGAHLKAQTLVSWSITVWLWLNTQSRQWASDVAVSSNACLFMISNNDGLYPMCITYLFII